MRSLLNPEYDTITVDTIIDGSSGSEHDPDDIGSGSGGSAVTVLEDGTELTTDATVIDVLAGITASEPVADEIDLAVDESEIDHDALLNYLANEHVDHSAVSVTGTGSLTGGGDLTASRTLDVSDGGVDTAELAAQAVTETEVDGSGGTDGQVLGTDGTASGASWVDGGGSADGYIADATADASTSIQAAHDALPATGGVIDVTRDYDNSDTLPIAISKPVTLVGHGWGTGTSISGSTSPPGLDFSGNTTDTVFQVDVGVEQPRHSVNFYNLRIEGGNIGIELGSGGFYRLEKCWIHAQDTSCLTFDGDGGGLYTTAEQCFFEDAGSHNVDMSAPSSGSTGSMPHATKFRNCLTGGAGGYGMLLDGFGVRVDGCAIEGASLAGLAVAGGSDHGVMVTGNYFEGNAQSDPGGGDDAHVHIQDGGVNSIKAFDMNYMSGAAAPNHGYDLRYTKTVMIDNALGQSASVNVGPSAEHVQIGWVDPRSDGNADGQPDVAVASSANYVRRQGLGQESANAEEPTAAEWQAGEVVDFTDSGDGSGDGVYLKLFDGTWVAI